jgi:hypothetical protein
MLFRYWGDRHADVQQFEPLLDRRAGGIAADALVRAIQDRHWAAQRIEGSVEALRDRLAAGQPPMLLIEDRPRRYHFVVAVGIDDAAVYVHDPAWGPRRRLTLADLLRRWKPAGNWMLMVLPQPDRPVPPASAPSATAAGDRAAAPPCDRLLDEALDQVNAKGLSAADALLGAVRQRCPSSSAPLSELAGVRFAEKRTQEAIALARRAVRLNPSDRYGWDVLGSSRFVQNDARGALQAWQHIGKPQLDTVRIEGLTHTRYSLVAQTLDLTPNTVLTERDFLFAERRLGELPDSLSARLSYRPESDGYATVDAIVVERPIVPRGPAEWGAAAAQAAIDREVVANLPGRTGQGELWTASYRWWNGRPRAAVAFTAPRIGALPGVWRVEGFWEAQTYTLGSAPPAREERAYGGVTLADWLTANLRYQLAGGLDSWNQTRRAISAGGILEQRLFEDRVSLSVAGTNWFSVGSDQPFRAAALRARFRSSPDAIGLVGTAEAGIDAASAAAPLALWSGAGEGRARPHLLRAHPLLDGGTISGAVFGRTVRHASVEAQRWLPHPALVRVGVAAFVDAASASAPAQVDTGVGVRFRLASRETLRVDYAHGVRDGADAVSVGWQVW